MVLVEADLASVELADATLHGLELHLHLLCFRGGVLDATGQARHGFVDRLHAGTHGVDLPGQPGQAFATVGFGACGGQMGTLGLGGQALAFGEFGTRPLQPGAGFGQLVEQLPFLGCDVGGLGFQRVGLGAAGCFGFGVEILGTLAGDADRRADPFGQRRQPKPRLLGVLRALAQCIDSRLVGFEFCCFGLRPGRDLVVLAAQRRLGLVGVVEFGLANYQVVGCQPEPSVAQVSLDGLGATGHLGLPAERLELTAQLGRQVGQPGQVGRHRVELADRLFLALAVLEHAGGFLDERAPVLWPRLQDLGELALADDDMHLAADA